jgi:hypothetical protein
MKNYKSSFFSYSLMSFASLLASLSPMSALAGQSGAAQLISIRVCSASQSFANSVFEISSSDLQLNEFNIRFDSSTLVVNGKSVAITGSDGNNVTIGQIAAQSSDADCTAYSVNLDPATTLTVSMSQDLIPHPCLSTAGVFPTPELCKTDTYDLSIANGSASTDLSCKLPAVVSGDFSAGWGTCSAYNE